MSINRRYITTAIVTIMCTVMASAQKIAVVSAEGTTTVYQTLQQVIENAVDGDVIYLPGGGFQISDDVKITKKVSIVGIGHKAKSENSDGNTVISGNLYFQGNSTGSSVMGCYISGNVNIGAAVHNIVMKYCNLNAVSISGGSTGTVVNQCYLRGTSGFGSASATLTNNVINSVSGLNGGIVKNNVIKSSSSFTNCSISQNIFFSSQSTGSGCVYSDNMGISDIGDNPINVSEIGWEALFKKYNNGNVTPASNFHFTDDYIATYRRIGLDGGTGFDDSGQPPLPFIMAKTIAGQTDASENLNIKIRVQPGGKK